RASEAAANVAANDAALGEYVRRRAVHRVRAVGGIGPLCFFRVGDAARRAARAGARSRTAAGAASRSAAARRARRCRAITAAARGDERHGAAGEQPAERAAPLFELAASEKFQVELQSVRVIVLVSHGRRTPWLMRRRAH